MDRPVSDEKAQLPCLVKRAKAGEDAVRSSWGCPPSDWRELQPRVTTRRPHVSHHVAQPREDQQHIHHARELTIGQLPVQHQPERRAEQRCRNE